MNVTDVRNKAVEYWNKAQGKAMGLSLRRGRFDVIQRRSAQLSLAKTPGSFDKIGDRK